MKAIHIYQTSDGELTKKYYALLKTKGIPGVIAMNIFRAQKCSFRAKQYRKRSHKDNAYDRKKWSIDQLSEILVQFGETAGITFGWKEDPNVLFGGDDSKVSYVFYVDLPTGQVSFHCRERGKGPDYNKEWDGVKLASQQRVLDFCDSLFKD